MTTTALDFWTAPQRALVAERYWNDVHAPHRDALMRVLRECAPFNSVLEVGANAGPNLRRIRQAWPLVALNAIDVNAEVLRYGAAQARGEGWSFWYASGAAEDLLPKFPGEGFDVLLSCYSLAYLAPEIVRTVLGHMLRIARKAVVLAEPMVTGGRHLGPSNRLTRREDSEGLVSVRLGEYRHDFIRHLESLVGAEISHAFFPVVPAVDRLNGVLLIRPGGAR